MYKGSFDMKKKDEPLYWYGKVRRCWIARKILTSLKQSYNSVGYYIENRVIYIQAT